MNNNEVQETNSKTLLEEKQENLNNLEKFLNNSNFSETKYALYKQQSEKLKTEIKILQESRVSERTR